ncbi:MAG: hypothetical protein ACXAD7_14075 [Candidatus Kariarchaeaceae archaeon]
MSLDPPTDPLNGDTDYDGLLDGYEGVIHYNNTRTNPTNPDTDGDGLGDMQELLLGSNPHHVDSDNDMVSDGDEYHKYGTSVFLNDTDMDGLTDGQELFWFHTSPFLYDSDGDTLGDAAEILDHYSDPTNDDTDHDGLTDYEELFVYNTLLKNPDTDNDGLMDGLEILILKTSPFLWDSDNDSIYYLDPTQETGIAQKWGDFDEYMAGSDPLNSDTDKDGISDAWEYYLASGHVPFLDPIPLDWAISDTDGDNLIDGEELQIANYTSLIYPFTGYQLIYPFDTSPTLVDTDFDGLNDTAEIHIYHTDANNPDSDEDTLSDYEEVLFHGTSPLDADTDGDGLLDIEEKTQVTLEGSPGLPIGSAYDPDTVYGTNATNPDTDGDLLPDGAEILFYGDRPEYNINKSYDPLVWDEDNNSIPDGLDIDSDYDGLPDGYEYYGNLNATFPFNSTFKSGGFSGGPFIPDSDMDGLPDGFEAFNLFTDPTNNDTDGDTFSDGFEERIGLDPLIPNNWTELQVAMAEFEAVFIESPMETSYNGQNILIQVNAPQNALKVTVRFYDETNSWSDDITLSWNSMLHSWALPSHYMLFNQGNYLIQTLVYMPTGETYSDEVNFAILEPLAEINEILNPSGSSNTQSGSLFGLIFGLFTGFGIVSIFLLRNQITPGLRRIIKRRETEMED